ncbi:hypothetical protein [Halosimplex carlsbadense]|uniref:hypothetical protein n=1 Tax=Halosimplex carlsbadense TaxID=171164 RepID=UPI001269145C|nr:hypothetical protein [Halosimplex carlsbadense]
MIENTPADSRRMYRIQWIWKETEDPYYDTASSYIGERVNKLGYDALFSGEHSIPAKVSQNSLSNSNYSLEDLWDDLGERDGIIGKGEVEASRLEERLSKSVRYDDNLLAADGAGAPSDGENNSKDVLSSIRDLTQGVNPISKIVPRELGEKVLSESASRIRVVYSSCDNFTDTIEECKEFDVEFIKTSPDLGAGHKVYAGPLHAYTPLAPFFKEEVKYQLRSPITCVWRENDEVSSCAEIVDIMQESGWEKRLLDQKRVVIMETQSGTTPRKNKKDTTSKASPEGVVAELADAVLKSEQWHIRLFDLPTTINRNYSHYCAIGQAHRDPWDHDLSPVSGGITFTQGRQQIEDIWRDLGFSTTHIDVGNQDQFNKWDGVICNIHK